MKPERLSEIKKELILLENAELVEICLKLAKYKKDNKEFLHYLLFESSDSARYIESVEIFLQPSFQNLSSNSYLKAKELRKILRVLNKHVKYIGSAGAEAELLMWYSANLLKYAGIRTSQKALYLLLIRQLQKIKKLIQKLHEDLQSDYKDEFQMLVRMAHDKIRDFKPGEFEL